MDAKKEMIVGIIAVRLDNLKDVTRHARLAFLITILASFVLVMAVWNVYFSTFRNIAFSLNDEKQQINSTALWQINRIELAKSWVDGLNVPINILGIKININDFPFIGSYILLALCCWLFLIFRREHIAILSLLEDMKKYLTSSPKNKKKHDNLELANLVFHGVANNFLSFIGEANNKVFQITDLPVKKKNKFHRLSDNFINLLTKFIKNLFILSIFFPAISVSFIIWADTYSTYNVNSPFRENHRPPAESVIERNSDTFVQIFTENFMGGTAGVLIFFICIGCFIFQLRTSRYLQEFEKALKGERADKTSDPEIEAANPELK